MIVFVILIVFVSQTLLDAHPRLSMKPAIWSDHSPFLGGLDIRESTPKTFAWRLNDHLLKDTVCLEAVRVAIKDFILNHSLDNTQFNGKP